MGIKASYGMDGVKVSSGIGLPMLHKFLFKYIRLALTPSLPLLCTLCFSLNTVCGPGSESGYIKIWIWIQF